MAGRLAAASSGTSNSRSTFVQSSVPIQPFSSPNTTRDDNDCPLCAIKTRRHCARRPVAASATACDTFSIAVHRAPPPAACADIDCQFQVPRRRRAEVQGHQELPSRSSLAEQQRRAARSTAAFTQKPASLASLAASTTVALPGFHHPIFTALQDQPAPARNTRREHAAW